MARREKIRLGDMLVQQDLISAEQLKFALEEQKRSGRKLSRILFESGASASQSRRMRHPFLLSYRHASPRAIH